VAFVSTKPGVDRPDEARWTPRRNLAVSGAFGVAVALFFRFDWHAPAIYSVMIVLLAGGYIFVGLAFPGPWMLRRPPLGRVLILFGFGTMSIAVLLMAAQYLAIFGAASWGGLGPPVRHWPLLLGLAGFITARIGMGLRDPYR
jgi:hypothetical protein